MMQNDSANLQYILQENKKNNDKVSYEDVLQQVDTLDEALPDMEIQYIYEEEAILGMDDYLASELDYQTNYIKKDLERIADYYEISKRKKRKDDYLKKTLLIFKKSIKGKNYGNIWKKLRKINI